MLCLLFVFQGDIHVDCRTAFKLAAYVLQVIDFNVETFFREMALNSLFQSDKICFKFKLFLLFSVVYLQ